jgi:phosphocarrier protein HPr
VIIKRKVKIHNPQGLHARPASAFVKLANKYESEVTVRKDDEAVNGKSIMGLMTLAAIQGSIIEIEASGPDAEKMVDELERFLLSDGDEGLPKDRSK